jgi:hypothetical protein
LIVLSGFNLGELRTCQAVQEKFGTPDQSGVLPDGGTFDQITTRRKIAHPFDQGMYCYTVGFTFGLSELICFPYQLFQAVGEGIVGQRIRFDYDVYGNVVKVTEYDHGLWFGRPAYP